MMRVASNQFRNQAVQTITEQQATIAKLQQQASTGQKVNRPSDDPLAAAEVERLRSDQARTNIEKRQEPDGSGREPAGQRHRDASACA